MSQRASVIATYVGDQQAIRARRRAALDQRVRAQLWSAVWEASQTMDDEEIAAVVASTLREIAADSH